MAQTAVQFDASWERVQRRYAQVAKNSPVRTSGLIAWGLQEGQKEAINQANIAIYDKPAPKGTTRTGALKKAIKTRKLAQGTDAGEVYLDSAQANRDGFYYPKLREGPPEGWATKTRKNYPQDPFWHNAKVITKARMRAKASETLRQYKRALIVS